ncbi:hypothetical protein Ait01nite_098320 [Actinoplanes italicus]|uniref:Uncharacterized protein n=1 Tax=Actinoplanes italicus TaxID=113567 RepID=A0A2T0JG80_9ACTN|nr:hypothetical protein [Actinoplanes italicus]PRX06647.1 hypothetical protein CLV67_14326 [Actinoplanes italicus]GIE36787.1 hypothetical protein Ait01nite_098320 [Actinoplanes italicus]
MTNNTPPRRRNARIARRILVPALAFVFAVGAAAPAAHASGPIDIDLDIPVPHKPGVVLDWPWLDWPW